MKTLIFIISVVAIIAVYDVIALIKGWRTITSWLRQWYKELPIIPYGFAAVFLGHVPLWIDFSFINKYICLSIFIIIDLCVIIMSVVLYKKDYWLKNKWFIWVVIGAIVGCLWYM